MVILTGLSISGKQNLNFFGYVGNIVSRETISTAMLPCFDRWCTRFDDIFKTKAQRKEFRHYLGRLLGESEIKNLSQIAGDSLDVSYHSLRHFLVRASWGNREINDRRLEAMKSYRNVIL